MAGDPRLNLFNFAGTILNRNPELVGTAHATSCPTVEQRLQSADKFQNTSALNTPGIIGAFANLAASVGGGTVGQGLTKLANISNVVRVQGIGALPPAAIGNGVGFVLNNVGINQNDLTTAQRFNPGVANATFGAASRVYNSVSQGKFSVDDIPATFSAFQNGSALISSLFTPNTNATQPPASQFGQNCGVGNYATDLIAFAPKYKFLFVVQFEFDPDFQEVLNKHGTGIDPAFVIKTSSRPAVDFEYEDINMYNFRTKIARKTMYQPITMRFLDDDKNNAFHFYTTYLKLISPIANVDLTQQTIDPLDAYDLVGGGMGFDQNTKKIALGWSNTVGQGYAASLGPYGDQQTDAGKSVRNILRRISIFHVYRQGRMMNVMHFYNPKITKMELDDLDMASSEGTEVNLTFSYDSLFIIPGYRMADDSLNYNLNNQTSDGIFPLGVDPSLIGDDGNPMDGFGMPFGQTTLAQNENTAPLTSAPELSFPTLSNDIASSTFLPNISAGGTGTDSTSTTSTNSLAQTVVTAPAGSIDSSNTLAAIPSAPSTVAIDPISGTAITSADTSLNIANVQTNANNLKGTISSNLQADLASATTPEQTVAAQKTAADATANVDNLSFTTATGN